MGMTELAQGLLAPSLAHCESLTLAQAIERALVSNPTIIDQKLTLRASEITHDNAWDDMFLPQINLGLTSSSSATVGQLPGSVREKQAGGSNYSHGYPSSTASLSLGSYTLYNFGKDSLTYEQAKLDWLRAKETYVETARSIKFKTISAFWSLKSALDKLDAATRSVELAQAIFDLQESRAALGKAAASDVSSSSVDLMNAKNLRDTLDTSAKNALWALNPLLGDPVGTPYEIDEQISFLPISLTEDMVYAVYLRESASMKTLKTTLKKAELALELEEKNKLPLPKITFSGITVSYNNSYYGNRPDLYTSSSGTTNLDVNASVSLTLPLLGSGGLFGGRTVELAQITRDQAELRLRDQGNRDKAAIYQVIQNIRQYEQTVNNNRESLKTSSEILEGVLQKIEKAENVSRLDLKDAIAQARQAEIALSESILAHLNYKTDLAQTIGVDYLPRLDGKK